MTALALLVAFRALTFTMPTETAARGACSGDTLAHSWMVAECWLQPRRSLWAPTDRAVWAAEWSPRLIAASPLMAPGARCTLAVSDNLEVGTLWVVARGPGGVGCMSNLVESKRP